MLGGLRAPLLATKHRLQMLSFVAAACLMHTRMPEHC